MKTQRRPTSRDATHAASWAASWSPGEYQAGDSFENVYSVAFDGTNDKITANYQLPSTFTVSYWINRSAAGTRYAFDARDASNTSAIYVHTSDQGSGYKLISNAFNDSSEISINAWHHIAVTYSSSASECKLYVDGSLDNTKSASLGTAATVLTIGTRYTNFAYLQGNLDEFSIWNSALGADTVAAIYNSGTPLNLSVDKGGYASSGDLSLWYRMGDATSPAADGTGSHTNNIYLFDQEDTSVGSEMVIADAYVSAEWYGYSGNTLTFGDDFMRCERTASGDSNGWFTYLRTSASDYSILNATPTTDSFYLLTFDVDSDDADAYVYMKFGNVASEILQGTGNGTKTVVYKKGSSSHEDYLEGRNISQGKYMKISNVSVKKINGAVAEMVNMDSADIETSTP